MGSYGLEVQQASLIVLAWQASMANLHASPRYDSPSRLQTLPPLSSPCIAPAMPLSCPYCVFVLALPCRCALVTGMSCMFRLQLFVVSLAGPSPMLA